jgi:NDP-sugar pyrophosphorylase family protein
LEQTISKSKIFQKAYLTDFIQELVDIGIKVHCVIIESGWKEIDTVEDYKKALIDFKRNFTKIYIYYLKFAFFLR